MVVVEVAGLFEGERSVVAGGIADPADDHLAEGRVHIEEEGPVDYFLC